MNVIVLNEDDKEERKYKKSWLLQNTWKLIKNNFFFWRRWLYSCIICKSWWKSHIYMRARTTREYSSKFLDYDNSRRIKGSYSINSFLSLSLFFYNDISGLFFRPSSPPILSVLPLFFLLVFQCICLSEANLVGHSFR